MQIYDNLHWLNGGASNAFLYELEDGFLLVDSGMPRKIDAVGYLAKLGHKPAALKHILVTHADIDHIGNVATIQKATGAQVYASAQSAELLNIAKTPSHNSPRIQWLGEKLIKYERVSAETIEIVSDGETLPLMGGLNVIAAPGHTPDQVVYHSVSTGIMFAGDALNSRKGKLQCSPKAISHDYDLARHTATSLAHLSPIIFCCGHGKPFLHEFDDILALFTAVRQ